MKAGRGVFSGAFLSALLAVTSGAGCNSILGFNPGTLSPGGLPCDTATGLTSTECDDGFVCMFKSCGKKCSADSQCPEGSRCFNVYGGADGACTKSSDTTCDVGCPTNTGCAPDNVCRTLCFATRNTCLSEQTCTAGYCYGADPRHDPLGGGSDGGLDGAADAPSTMDASTDVDAMMDAPGDTMSAMDAAAD